MVPKGANECIYVSPCFGAWLSDMVPKGQFDMVPKVSARYYKDGSDFGTIPFGVVPKDK